MISLSPVEILIATILGLGTGVLGALLGTGGGVFLVPLLILGLGVPTHFAIGTSIVSVIATSSAVASANVERGTANMRLGMTLEVGTTLGAICGALVAHLLAPQALEAIFGIILLPIAVLMWRGVREDNASANAVHGAKPTVTTVNTPVALGFLGGQYTDPVEGNVAYRMLHLPWGLAISYCAGAISGLLGIGGGVMKVPALHLACGVPMKAAAATSNFMIGVTAAASVFLYYGSGEIRPVLTASVVLGVLMGSALGSYLNRYLRSSMLSRLFSVLLVLVAIQMIVRSIRQG